MREYVLTNIVDGIKSYSKGFSDVYVEGKIKVEPIGNTICMEECEVDLLDGFKKAKDYSLFYKLTDLGAEYKIDRCGRTTILNGEPISIIIDKDRFNKRFSEFLKTLF